MRYVYFDTDALRNFGTAFKKTPLEDRLRNSLVLSPITAAEIMSQLVTAERAQILEQIQAMRNWLPNPPKMLPVPSVVIAEIGFNRRLLNDTHLNITHSLDICLQTSEVEQLVAEASKQRDFMDRHKKEEAEMLLKYKNVSGRLSALKEPPYDSERIQAALQEGMASRIGMQETDPLVRDLPKLFSAFFEYENARFREAAENRHYNPANKKNINDALDSEQLIYLSNPDLFFLTCDRKYSRRVKTGKQAANIITVTPADLLDPTRATNTLKIIIEVA